MDPTRDLSRIGQENPSDPPSPNTGEDLFSQFFDWDRYLDDAAPWEKQAHRATPQHLDKLITDIHPLIDSLGSHRFFTMGNSFGSDDEAASSSSPGYSGHPSPPELVQGEGSTSPSDHSGPVLPEQALGVYDTPTASLAEIRNHDDQWTYPQTYSSSSGSSSPTQHRISHHDADPKPPLVHVPGPGATRPAVTTTSTRKRQLENPDQTADVRKSGACLPCRITKTRCHESGVCPTCRTAFPDHSHLACGRKSLQELLPALSRGAEFWSHQRPKETAFCAQSKSRVFTGRPKPISIFFSPGGDSPFLSAHVQPYRWKDEDEESQLEKIAFSSDCPPQHETLQRWVEDQIQFDRGSEFPHELSRFLMAYSREGSGLPMHDLAQKVHQMSCFFRIWKAPAFYCRDPTGKVASLPISVQVQLRVIVLRGIYSIERDVMRELDVLTSPSQQPKPDDKLALWASMWQLILIYREVTLAARGCLAKSERATGDNQNMQARCRFFLDSFFPQLTILYHYLFRMKKSIEVSVEWLKAPKYARHPRGKAIEHTGMAMIDCRKKFLQTLQSSKTDVDQLLCVFVVNHELKKLNARKRTNKASSRSKAGHDDDDCDD